MASGKNDVNDSVDDVIKTLDLKELRTKDDESENGEGDGHHDSKNNNSAAQKTHPGKGQDGSSSAVEAPKNGDSSSKRNSSHGKDNNRSSKSSERWKILKSVKVEKLPQRFVCKYVGSKPCTGLWGVRHTRQPVDALVAELRKLPEGEDLPLVNVKVCADGLKATLHIHSTSSRTLPDAGLLPLMFISYAVQDPRYSRIFVFILVREMSSRERKTECHAYLCSSDVVARQMALSMALAFGEFSKKLEGKQHRFQVDLRNTDELETELSAKTPDGATGTEFDA